MALWGGRARAGRAAPCRHRFLGFGVDRARGARRLQRGQRSRTCRAGARVARRARRRRVLSVPCHLPRPWLRMAIVAQSPHTGTAPPRNLWTSPRASRRELFGRPARRASLRHGGLHAQDAQRRWTAKQTRPEGLPSCAPATALNALTVEPTTLCGVRLVASAHGSNAARRDLFRGSLLWCSVNMFKQ